ncbi:uncharacterized protein LOC110053519 isoform X1 [Orbicella faveolata]|uniref:uncharacterized protein LOC110053519 isoform X1 n=1 Tax=Orbicella faveolata TaxID=48498 RepID=UPI0009E5E677|nr:uncharacterized protein LOC110053519 isoform X1 [Orbicella faveolata]
MLESNSNSERSYDSDDSEYNFIPGHINIGNIEVEDDENLGEEQVSQPDPDNYKPYEDKPIATEEWLSEYKKRQETQVEFERKLQDCYDGKQLVNSWCKCGACSAENLQNPNEFQCCMEIEECVECLSSERVIEEVSTKLNCVTQHPRFSQVCLQKWSLRLAADKYKTRNKTKYHQTGTENRFLRGISYREFTRLVHGYLGGRRIPLPACTYHAIRTTFPEEKSSYAGFETEDVE